MEAVNLICFRCKHFDDANGGCAAFENIPNEITSGENLHSKPLPGQPNDIVFESLPKEELEALGLNLS
jgi:hypothetical protein